MCLYNMFTARKHYKLPLTFNVLGNQLMFFVQNKKLQISYTKAILLNGRHDMGKTGIQLRKLGFKISPQKSAVPSLFNLH